MKELAFGFDNSRCLCECYMISMKEFALGFENSRCLYECYMISMKELGLCLRTQYVYVNVT
jgi:hypothetical protein